MQLVYMHHLTEYAPAKIGDYPNDIPWQYFQNIPHVVQIFEG